MIFVDGLPYPAPGSQSRGQGRELLASLLDHPALISASNRLKATPERKVSVSDQSPPVKHVYVFQREYATVDPAAVELVGMDEATTCVGLVIRNRNNGMTSISHMDFPKVVDKGLIQMLSLVADHEAILDVHLIGAFNDASNEHDNDIPGSEGLREQDGYSMCLCSKIIDALHNSHENFHLQTLCVLEHNTKRDSNGNACPIISGIVVNTLSGSIMPASFARSSRCPDEIVRRIRVTVSSEDSSWKGRLLKTYDTFDDKFHIAPCYWLSDWGQIAFSLQQLSDSEILLRCSTSPSAESPDFVENERSIWSYLIQYPDWRQTFVGGKPRVFKRTSNGGWQRN
ncbi:protein N-terminal asparagine amidohydrolase isoform X2 [Phoenix dactylifera]|uniref:Protein N-terminal asparagine amidohydrolase isoform X2 n=1 Tax=Phoenix dactylifera TaxID=42345 RepID=A0A8B7CT46_PHODC|nr:protein N-terminal asparagine amidohydrolase isoform X2 [Phoenix dactylifera]